jgi:hypothetical protein
MPDVSLVADFAFQLDTVPASPLGRYRILDDYDLPLSYGFQGHSRTALPDWPGAPITPETCRINGGFSSCLLSDFAQKRVYELNNPTGEYKYVIGDNGGWVNYGHWPRVEVLTFSGNVVDVIRIDGNRAYIRTWAGETDDPCVVHLWYNIGDDDTVYQGGWKGPAYIVLAYPGDLWIPLDKLVKI